MDEVLRKILMSSGISGSEKEIGEILSAELIKCCDDVYFDKFGNLVGRKATGEHKIMLTAHMDEVGLLVKQISKEGFIHFIKIGGVDDKALLGQRVVIKAKKADILGIIGLKPSYMRKEEERKQVDRVEDMYIDIGCKGRDEALKEVAIGDQIVFEPNAGVLNGSLFFGKAVDNRVGCYSLIKIMERININADIYSVFTVQEEVGLRGALTASFKINPDFALVIDTAMAGDTPDIAETESSLKLGQGVAITIIESSGRGVMVSDRVRDLITNTAMERNIKFQIDIGEYGVTDGTAIAVNGEGVNTGILSIPVRYMHSPTSVFSIDDVNSAIDLSIAVTEKIAKGKARNDKYEKGGTIV